MVNAAKFRPALLVLLLAGPLLTASAWLRSAEYDEQYTLFLTAGTPRPDWPRTVFPAGAVAAIQDGHTTVASIARDLRTTDVHPPLYFWAVSVWRTVFGPSLFAARMFSVVCGLISLALIGVLARRSGIPPATPMLLTLLCYGFAYTNAIARGFAPAQMLLLAGVTLVSGRMPFLAGICLGAACCCNYLAVFVAVVAATAAWVAIPGALPFLVLDAWFFLAQHGTRTGQFPPFSLTHAVARLAEYQIAAVFGGLPLYADGLWRIAVGASIALLCTGVVVSIVRPPRVALAAALATPAGLLLLGALFDNTPIELRYLSFGLPFVALLLARAPLLPLVLAVQIASIAGLLTSPRTMQPARAAAAEAARFAGNGIVLLPRGNDGVGIVGAFGIEAPPALPVLLITPTDAALDRAAGYDRVVLALMAQDRDSKAAIAATREALAAANWRRIAIGSNVEVYQRVDRD